MSEPRPGRGDRPLPPLVASALAQVANGPVAVAAAVLAVLVVGVVLGGLAAGGLALWLAADEPEPAPPPPVFTSPGPTVERLEAMGQIVSTRVVVTDILTGKGEGYRACWLIRGDALLTCDLKGATVVTRDEAAKTALIRVPGIRVLSPRVDHAATKTWDFQKLSWMPWTWGDQSVVHDAAMHHAQRLVERTAGGEEYRRAAKDQAELVLKQAFAMAGWDVAVQWEE